MKRITREHTPMDDSLIAVVVEKRHEARTAADIVIKSRRRTRQTQTAFLAHVTAYCAIKKGSRRGKA